MPRSVDKDLRLLSDFIDSYSISKHLSDKQFNSTLKQSHKAYFVILTLLSNIEFELNKNPIDFVGQNLAINSEAYLYLRESVSDFGNGLFCCLHGAYKSGHMALRSSIENYVRAIAGMHDKKALNTTSVYQLFIIAKTTSPFSGINQIHLSNLRGIYSDLCKFTHSATPKHMASIKSLSYFPTHDAEKFNEWIVKADKTMKNQVSCIFNLIPEIYLTSHFKSKEILDLGFLSNDIRTRILGG